MNTLRNKTLLTSLLGLMLILALVFTISITFQTSETQIASADPVFTSQHITHDGEVYAPDENFTKLVDKASYTVSGVEYTYVQDADGKWHMAENTLRTRYSGKTLVKITSGQELKDFITNSADNKVGYLMQNIDYNLQSLGVIGSDKVFKGTFDGNGYKVTMTSPTGGQELAYNKSYAGQNGEVHNTDSITGNYYSGMFCAVNEGSIKNVNFVWNSSLSTAGDVFNNEKLGAKGSVKGSEKWTSVTGIITGLNNGGQIENCRLDIVGAFSVCKKKGDANSLASNASYTGGIAGSNGKNGLIKRCTVNNVGGILGMSEGMTGSGENKLLASAGGIAGFIVFDEVNIPKIQNCSIMGSGPVRTTCNYSDKGVATKHATTYAGGAVGSTVLITEQNIYNTKPILAENLDGLVSSWTGDATRIRWDEGGARNPKTLSGILFGDVGTTLGDTPSAVPNNMVMLFDIIALNTVGGVSQFPSAPALDDGPISDSRPQNIMGYGTWLGIYSISADGTVSAEYDYSRDGDPIIIKAIANDFAESTSEELVVPNEGSRYYYVKNPDTNEIIYGKFIFGAKYSTENYKDPNAATRVDPSEFAGAEFARIAADQKGTIEYNFGELVKIDIQSANTNANTEHYIHDNARRYNGQQVKLPTLVLTRKNNQNVTPDTSLYTFDKTYQRVDDYGNVVGAKLVPTDGNMHLPGVYTFKAKAVDAAKSEHFAYYDEETRVAVAKSDTNNENLYAIFIGENEQLRATVQTSEIRWGTSDTITFGYLSNGAYMPRRFSYYTCSLQANATLNAEDYLVMNASDATKVIDINTNGVTNYFINAYIDDPYTAGAKLKVGTTSVTTYIDTEAPEITNIQYYQVGEDLNDLLPVFEGELVGWLTNDILIKYDVTDKGLSGMASGKGHTSVNKTTNKWECQLLLDSYTNSQTVEYKDLNGNSVTRTFAFNIDTIKTQLTEVETLNDVEYINSYNQYGVCPFEIIISFVPLFGESGARLEYSYQKDENNEDIWLVSNQELYANQTNEFKVNFDIDSSNLKLRLVNNQNLYLPSLANGDGCVSTGIDGEAGKIWNVKILVAHVGITLDNIFYIQDGVEKSLGALTNTELAALFNKQYDGTDRSIIDFYVKVYSTGTTLMDNTALVYNSHYENSRPKILEENIKVDVIYDSINAGVNGAKTSVKIVPDYNNDSAKMYLFYFIEKGRDYLIAEDIMDCSKEYTGIQSTISPYLLTINLANYTDQLKSSYVYGQEVPSMLLVDGVNGEIIELKLTSANDEFKVTKNAEGIIEAYPAAKQYNINATMAVANTNYRLAPISDFAVTINKKVVPLMPLLDGVEQFSTKISYNGVSHILTATYEDVFGVVQNAKVVYYKNSALTGTYIDGATGITEIGHYWAKITIEDDNYLESTSADYVVKQLEITKGHLKIQAGKKVEQQYEYNNKAVNFEIVTVGEYATDKYSATDFEITYYEIKGDVPDTTNPLTTIKNVGRYLVKVSMRENSYFYASDYEDSYLTINKADVNMTANSIEFVYEKGKMFGFDVVAAELRVVAKNSEVEIIRPADEIVKYYDYTGTQIVSTDVLTTDVFEIWHKNTKVTPDNKCLYETPGNYLYQLVFKGDKNFVEKSIDVWLIINPAQFDGLVFGDETAEDKNTKTVNFNGDPFTFELKANAALTAYLAEGAKIKYKSQSGEETKYVGEEGYVPFEFTTVGTYYVSAIIEMTNYATTTITGKLVIDKTAMTGIEIVPMDDVVYDGGFHPGVFKGFDVDDSGNLKCEYYKGYEKYKMIEYVYYRGSKVSVEYSDDACPIDVGTYKNGKIIFECDDYAKVELKTNITIVPQQISNDSIDWQTLANNIKRINSNTDLSKLRTTFTNEQGEKISCNFAYYKDGERVELSDKGTLPAGKYTVKIDFGNNNYVTASTAEIEIKAASSTSGGSSSVGGDDDQGSTNNIMTLLMDNIMYIGIGAGALVVIVVIAIVASKSKRKKKSRKKGKPKKEGEKPKPKTNVSQKDKATF